MDKMMKASFAMRARRESNRLIVRMLNDCRPLLDRISLFLLKVLYYHH